MSKRTLCFLGSVVAFTLACSGEAPVAVSPPVVIPPVVADVPAAPPATPVTDIPYYRSDLWKREDLADKSLRELSIMRNTIFARAGNPFRKKWVNDYFSAQSWYHAAEKTDFSKLTENDKLNASLIGDYEATLTRADLVARKTAILDAWGGDFAAMARVDPDSAIELQLLSAALGEYAGDPSIPVEQRSPLADPSVLDREIATAQLSDLSRRDLRILRNTIFARHGRAFKSPQLQAYFAQKTWYEVDTGYTDDRLTPIDQANIATILSVENKLGGMLTEAEHEEIERQDASMMAA